MFAAKSTALTLSLALICAIPGAGCSSDDDESLVAYLALAAAYLGATRNYGGVQATGDVLTASIGRDSAVVINETAGWRGDGAAARLDSGFIQFTAASFLQSGAAQTLPVPAPTSYALEVPGLAAVVNPIGAGSVRTMGFASVGDCEFNGAYNIVQTATNTSGQMIAGTATVGGSSGAVSVSGSATNLGGGAVAINPPIGVCSGGRITMSSGGSVVTGFASSAGAVVLDLGTGQGGVVGFKQDSGLNGAGAFSGKTFIGLLNGHGGSSDNTQLIRLSCTANVCTGLVITDARTGATTAAGSVTITISSIVNGLGAATNSATQNMGFAAVSYGGKIALIANACASGAACSGASASKGAAFFVEQ